MLNGYTIAKFDQEDIFIGLFTIAITILWVGQRQRVRYAVIFSVIAVVELTLVGLLWWALY
jgi:hypothetical protein